MWSDGRGHTSISEAAAQGHENVIRLLLAEGANPNAINDTGRSALWRACYNGHMGAVTILLQAGAESSVRDKVCSKRCVIPQVLGMLRDCRSRYTLRYPHLVYNDINSVYRPPGWW